MTDLALWAEENILATYHAVGSVLPGAERKVTSAYSALLSDLPHPSGNFAARLRLDPWSAGELRDLSATRPAFQVVSLPSDCPEHLPELLRRASFEPVQRLVSMVAEPDFGLSSLDMTRCEDEDERRRTGLFMADSFFAREKVTLRAAMAEAIAHAPELAVYEHRVRDRTVAAVTLTRTPHAMGIYNLCVSGPQRGRGLGTDLVAWGLAQAAAEGRAACLQCAPSLEDWYARQGFVRAGVATVWSARRGG